MGYRTLDKPPKPEDMLPRFTVRNGALLRLAFDCSYLGEGHDPHYHDYINWPAPNYHPGPICQMYPPRNRHRWFETGPIPGNPVNLEPINLIEEGYTIAEVTYEKADLAQYLDTEASIDGTGEYDVIRMSVHADFPVFEDKPVEARFTLFVKKPDGSAIDAVCHGIINVLPGSPSVSE